MFQFRAFPSYTYLIQYMIHGYCPCVFPHSEISGSSLICSSPKLIAACHVLLRLLMPRHSPCALISLTFVRSIHYLQASRKIHFWFLSFFQKNYAGSIKEYLAKIVFYPKFFVSLLLPSHNLSSSIFTMFSFQGTSYELVTRWWAKVDSNHRPHDYQSCALAS